jgi:hypothetical protein
MLFCGVCITSAFTVLGAVRATRASEESKERAPREPEEAGPTGRVSAVRGSPGRLRVGHPPVPESLADRSDSHSRDVRTSSRHLVDTTEFKLTLKAPGPYSVGHEGRAEIILVAKKPFKINEQYPYRFAPTLTGDFVFTERSLDKTAARIDPRRAVVPVRFTPEGAGTAELGGIFSFSVCTDDRCLLEKHPLSVPLDVMAR